MVTCFYLDLLVIFSLTWSTSITFFIIIIILHAAGTVRKWATVLSFSTTFILFWFLLLFWFFIFFYFLASGTTTTLLAKIPELFILRNLLFLKYTYSEVWEISKYRNLFAPKFQPTMIKIASNAIILIWLYVIPNLSLHAYFSMKTTFSRPWFSTKISAWVLEESIAIRR